MVSESNTHTYFRFSNLISSSWSAGDEGLCQRAWARGPNGQG
jgi:hypothetical protein